MNNKNNKRNRITGLLQTPISQKLAREGEEGFILDKSHNNKRYQDASKTASGNVGSRKLEKAIGSFLNESNGQKRVK